MAINVHDPTELTLVGTPISTRGDFPVSVAVSPRTGQVCVLNGGTLDPKSVNGVKYEFKTTYLQKLNIDFCSKCIAATDKTNIKV